MNENNTNKTDNVFTSNTLFHFTDNINNLMNIITDGFYPHYCLENFSSLFNERLKIAFSMICFCDLPLSRINNHLNVYGNFGIGLNKQWGIRNGISPVLYVHKDSHTWKSFSKIMIRLSKKSIKMIKKRNRLRDYTDLNRMLTYIKTYEGYFRRKISVNNYRYYNEREWRFIPSVKGHWPTISEHAYYELSRNERFLKEIELRLSFLPKDVKYIIVEKEIDIPKIYDKIWNNCKRNYKKEISKKLLTKIISAEKLKEDF